MKENHYRRINMELQLIQLAKDAGESIGNDWYNVSNREILLMINAYLKKFGCIQFTTFEIAKISRLMNN